MTLPTARVLVWDWTVRLFHWLLVLGIVAMWWTAEQGMMDRHRRLGLALLGLIVYRLVWGLIGPATARFSSMLVRPGTLVAYIGDLAGRRHRPHFGHNPAGSLSVFAILAALATQIATGLFAVDVDGLESGPLARGVSFETGRLFAEIHETSFNVLLALIALHAIAIAAYLFVLRDNLVRPMVTGHRPQADFNASPLPSRAPWPRVLAAAAIAIATVYGVVTFGR